MCHRSAADTLCLSGNERFCLSLLDQADDGSALRKIRARSPLNASERQVKGPWRRCRTVGWHCPRSRFSGTVETAASESVADE